MRLAVPVVAIAVGFSPAAAQDPGPLAVPDPPNLPRDQRLRLAAEFLLSDLLQAIRSGDTLALAVLVPEAAIPASERETAGRAGCRLSSAARRIGVPPGPDSEGRAAAPVIPLDVSIRMDAISGGVTVLVRLVRRTPTALQYGDVTLVAEPVDGERVALRSASGLLLSICGFAQRGGGV